MSEGAQATLAGGFNWIDWAAAIGLFALTHWIGKISAGKPATIREFFLGGRKLPWTRSAPRSSRPRSAR